jgi:hypothetical protein
MRRKKEEAEGKTRQQKAKRGGSKGDPRNN